MIEVISDDIKQMFSSLSTKSVQKDIEKKMAKSIQLDQKRLGNILKEIEHLKKDKTVALRMKIRGEIQDEEYRLLIEDNGNQLAKLNEEKAKLEQGLLHQKQTIDFTKLVNQVEQFVKNPILDEEMLHKLIERIEIKEDGSPRMFYRFSDPYISSIFSRATHSTPHASSSGTCLPVGLPRFDSRLLPIYLNPEPMLPDCSLHKQPASVSFQ